jgi:hypothetical protein
VTQFIIGIIGNILGHVAIEILERKYIGRISDVSWAIVGLCGSTQLIVLGPQIALDDFRPCCEPEKIRIAFTESVFALVAFAIVALVCLRFALGHQ